MLFAGKIKSEYPAWSPTTRNTFFSRFSCSMVTDFTAQTVRQDWYSSVNPTGPTTGPNHVQTISDPCKENNQGNVQTYLKHLPSVTPGTSSDALKQQLALQRKRSGDQMQALAIKRLGLTPGAIPGTTTGSELLHVSSDQGGDVPTNAKPGTSFPHIRRHTWLITHDLTLCSYALFLGINVLYTTSTGKKTGNNVVKTITSLRLISPENNFN
jgi:hypothetical protein